MPETTKGAAAPPSKPNVPTTSNGGVAKSAPEVLRPGSIGGLRTYKPSELQDKINMLLYGEPGIGKTWLIGSACEVPLLGKVLVLNLEDGAKTLKGSWGDHPNLEVVTPRTFGQVQKVFDELHSRKGAGFGTVVVDNATEGQKMGIEYFLDNRNGDFSDFDDPSWANQGWNRSGSQIRKMIRYFKGLPMHTIFVSWRKDFSKVEENKERWGPAFSKTLAGEVPGMFDSVFYYKWKTIGNAQHRVLQTKGTEFVVAKDRDGGHKMPETIVDPTMAMLCKHWGLTD